MTSRSYGDATVGGHHYVTDDRLRDTMYTPGSVVDFTHPKYRVLVGSALGLNQGAPLSYISN